MIDQSRGTLRSIEVLNTELTATTCTYMYTHAVTTIYYIRAKTMALSHTERIRACPVTSGYRNHSHICYGKGKGASWHMLLH